MFNILTPTYNRCHTLPRVHESLLAQTYKAFKWIIVDDGSTDGTKDLVNQWINNSQIQIEYYVLSINEGKPGAVNYGLEKCDMPYTIIADSDDDFEPETLEQLEQLWSTIDNCSAKIGAIWTLTKNQKGEVQGDYFPKDIWQTDFDERVLNRKSQIAGDKWTCWKTDILRNQKLFTNKQCHIQESHTWNEINRRYDFLCLNISFLNVHFTEGSLINSKKTKKQNAATYYFGSYYGLRNVSNSDIIFKHYYRVLAFEYIKSKLYFSDKELMLSTSKFLVCLILFLYQVPSRIMLKIG
ncbi:MAG: glycosyltransferase family 2 protein [Aquaticitalea sp.]